MVFLYLHKILHAKNKNKLNEVQRIILLMSLSLKFIVHQSHIV